MDTDKIGIKNKKYLSLKCEEEFSKDRQRTKILAGLVEQLKDTSRYYIYNLKINVALPAHRAIENLKKDNLNTLLLTDYREQCPKLRLIYSEAYERNGRSLIDTQIRFEEIEACLKLKIAPIDSSNIYRSTRKSKFVDYTSNLISRIYYFPTDVNINSIIEDIETLNINNLFAEECSQYYYLQFLSRDNNLGKVSSFLKKYLFIEDVIEAKTGFVNEECDLYSGY